MNLLEIVIVVVVVIFLIFGIVVFFGAPYVPAKSKAIKHAFDDLYHIDAKDLLLDIGSGDGRVLREAARHGARAIGFELNPVLVMIANAISRKQPHVTTKLANLWTTKFPDQTTIVYVFINSRDASKLVRKVEREATRLGRPLFLMSFAFQLDAPFVRRDAMHFLYKIRPLQSKKA